MSKTSLNQALEVLGGNVGMSFEQLKRQYKMQALNAHPDKSGDTVTMAEINAAWKVIKKHQKMFTATSVAEPIEAYKLDPLHVNNVPSFKSRDTLIADNWYVVDTVEDIKYTCGDNVYDDPFLFMSRKDEVSIKSSMLNYTRSEHGGGSITDVTNAMRTGKTCRSYRINHPGWDNDYYENFSNWTKAIGVENIEQLFAYLESVTNWIELNYTDTGMLEIKEFNLTIYRENEKSSGVFSPLLLDTIKPVTKAPKKWTKVHFKKLLANGQFSHLKQNFYFTDDYAMDAALGDRRGYIQNPLRMLCDDWGENDLSRLYTSVENGVTYLRFGAHSNDSRQFAINLDNRYPDVDMADIEEQLTQTKLLAA